MKIGEIHRVYFVGIGGIGMSALARYFSALGKTVRGYDKVRTDITKGLESLGIEIQYTDVIALIPDSFSDKETTLVVYTPAISSTFPLLSFFKNKGLVLYKRAEVLGMITRETQCLAVAGTHGKTTTSAILGFIMERCGTGATSFLGGIAEDYKSNLILGESSVSVVEADEYDRSFLQLSPDIACVTSMDADHLDIYGEASVLEETFASFAAKVSTCLIVKKGLPLKGKTYAIESDADYMINEVKVLNGRYNFSIKTPLGKVDNVIFPLPGRHNLSNALAAMAMAVEQGVPLEKVVKVLPDFKGVKRRFSFRIRTENLVLIDDYAHHPTELAVVEEAVRELYPSKKITAVFQPHLFSRTQDFMEDFALVLSKFDEVLLLDIYPAREAPISGVTSGALLAKITKEEKSLVSKRELLVEISNRETEVVLMLGAGDIGVLVGEVEQVLKQKKGIC